MEIRADHDAEVNQLFLAQIEFCPHRIEINSFCINGPPVTLGAVCHGSAPAPVSRREGRNPAWPRRQDARVEPSRRLGLTFSRSTSRYAEQIEHVLCFLHHQASVHDARGHFLSEAVVSGSSCSGVLLFGLLAPFIARPVRFLQGGQGPSRRKRE